MRSAAHSRRRKASGTCTRMPAPSPVSGSQPHAPRWVRFWRTVSPFSMMSCERSPFTLTTKPTPHASRSVRGSRSHRGLGWCISGSPRVRVALAVPPRALAGLRGRGFGGVEAEPARVQDGAVTGDDARGLELLDALEHGRGAEPHLLTDADERRAAVLLQQPEDAEVYLVQLDVRVPSESHKAERALAGTFS